jgi:hypothetical protein
MDNIDDGQRNQEEGCGRQISALLPVKAEECVALAAATIPSAVWYAHGPIAAIHASIDAFI